MKNPPEYRPFRIAAWVVYGAICTVTCGGLLISVYAGAKARMGTRPEPAPKETVTPQALASCTTDLDGLYRELNEQIDNLPNARHPTRTSLAWEKWSPGWRDRLLAVGARCRLAEGDVEGSKDLHVAYDRLNALHGYYTTLVTQFSKEIGPTAEKLQNALEKAHQQLK